MTMRGILLTLLLIGVVTAADDRKKRQAQYGGGYQGYNGAASYQAPRQHQPQQHQPQQNYYQPQAAYGGHQQAHQQPAPSHYAPAPAHKPAAAPGEEEKNEGPHPLQQLLEKSKFECGPKKDGYYADSDVGCQAFHYCVGGHKHSMMCPAGTVFHQVHLNCVPSDQDICSKADKFFFVNDYLHKQLEQKGPNNTVMYQQRYYPEGYAVGDPFIPPVETQGQAGHGGYAQAPAYGQAPQHHQAAGHQPVYGSQGAYQHQPQQHHARPAYQQQAAAAVATPSHAAPSQHVQHFPQAPAGYSHQQAAPSYHAQRAPAPAPAYGAQPQQQHHPGVLPPHAQYGAAPRSRFATQY